mgnify:CR=1 FL=1
MSNLPKFLFVVFGVIVALGSLSKTAIADSATGGPVPTSTATTTTTAATGTAASGIGSWFSSLVSAEVGASLNALDVKNAIYSLPPTLQAVDKMNSLAAAYATAQKACEQRYSMATNLCVLNRSPAMQTFTLMLPTLTTGLSTVVDQCSSVSKIADALQIGLTAYNVACAGAKVYCDNACGKAKISLEGIKKLTPEVSAELETKCAALTTAPPAYPCDSATRGAIPAQLATLEGAVDKELNEGVDAPAGQSVAARSKTCGSYGMQLASSIPAGLQLAKKMQADGDACKKQTDGNNTDDSSDQQTALNCAGADANTPECICINSPRTPGCQNGLASLSATAMGKGVSALKTAGAKSTTGVPSSGNLGGLGGDGFGPAGGGGGKAGGGALSGGGGAGVGGGGAGGGKGDGRSAEPGVEVQGGNMVGEGGGAGGGGRGGSGYGGSNSKLKAYMPGGAKDPKRKMAGWSLPNDITGQAGKSNWEKVRDRYNDNRRSFLGE